MTIFLLLIILAANPVPAPYQPPSWENLVPWMFGFFGLLVSSVMYFIMNRLSKQVDGLHETIDTRLDKMANAIYLMNRARLIQMVADPNVHPAIKEQCETMVKEIEDGTRK